MAELTQLPPEARSALERLVASSAMSRAPRVHAVLKFLVGEILSGRADTVNELRIGEGAFGRPGSYNPAEDNIVRVTVGHLRTRLEEFYRAEGQQESWVLEIPKGRYVPMVRQRDLPVERPEIATVAVQIEQLPQAPTQSRAQRRWLIPVGIAALAVLFAVPTYQVLGNRVNPSAPRARGLLQLLFQGRTTPVTVVVTDENLMAYRRLFGKTVLLSSYISRDYATAEPKNAETQRAMEFVSLRHATSTASATVAVALQAALQPYGVNVRHPAEVSTPDFGNDSVILLGGPFVNPWVQLFEDKLDFRTYVPPDGAMSEIHNAHPQAGESGVYAAHTENGIEVSYLRVALQPNLTGRGRVVLIGGIRGASQEAGCNLLLDPAWTDQILKRFAAPNVAQLPPFELLLEVRGVSHTPLDVRIVAHRAR